MKKEGEKYYRKAKQELTLKQRRKYQEDYKMTTWIINFYHTEAMYKAGIVSFSQKRTGPREAVYNEAKNLAKARGDFMFEVVSK